MKVAMSFSKRVLLVGLLASTCLSQTASAGGIFTWREYTALYVFGDSLSDPGNAYAVSGTTVGDDYEPIPAAPYDTRRFSNGPTWAEVLANELKTYRGGLPAFKSGFFGNYAFGGARASGGTSPDFGQQVGLYLQHARGSADPRALYVVQFGGNDIRAALEAAGAGQDPNAVILGAINAIVTNIGILRDAGARHVLVANAPNVGEAPVIEALGLGGPASAMSGGFNFALDMALAQLAQSGLNVYRVDFYSFVTAASAMPEGFGFADAQSPCLPVFPPATEVCNDPDQHLFWDGIHPTRAAHRIVGNIAVNALGLD